MSEFLAEVRSVQVGSVWFRPVSMTRDMMQPVDRRHVRRIIDNIIQAGLAHEQITLVFEATLIVDVKPFHAVREPYPVQAKILTLEGGRCKFAVLKADAKLYASREEDVHITGKNEEDREWILPVDRNAISTIVDSLMEAAVQGEERVLKVREGIIIGVEQT